MTLIAAIVDNKGTIHAMSDSIGSNTSDKLTMRFPKMALKSNTDTGEKMIIGATGSMAYIQFCTRIFLIPDLPKPDDDDEALYDWLLQDFRSKFREQLKSAGMLPQEFNADKSIQGSVIFGVRGAIMWFDGLLGVAWTNLNYGAVGNGDDSCCGVLHYALSKYPDKKPGADRCKEYLIAGQRAASDLKQGVGPPYIYINTEGEVDRFEK